MRAPPRMTSPTTFGYWPARRGGDGYYEVGLRPGPWALADKASRPDQEGLVPHSFRSREAVMGPIRRLVVEAEDVDERAAGQRLRFPQATELVHRGVDALKQAR